MNSIVLTHNSCSIKKQKSSYLVVNWKKKKPQRIKTLHHKVSLLEKSRYSDFETTDHKVRLIVFLVFIIITQMNTENRCLPSKLSCSSEV